MAAREFVLLVKESSLNTPMASPVAGTDSIYIRLTEGNALGLYTHPVYQNIPFGGGLAITADVVSDHYEVKGSLKTQLYPAQAQFLLGWMLTRINSGQTTPWVTTEPPGDLASVSVYHAIQQSDGTFRRKRFSGVKVNSGTIAVSRDSTTASLSLDLTACRSFGNQMDGTGNPDATEFPAPADTAFPTGPYTFRSTAGHMTVGSVRVGYEDLNLSFTNAIDGRWYEAAYLQVLQFCGRSSKLDATLRILASPDDRVALEAITAQAASVGFFNGVTGQNLTIQYNGKNIITDLPYDSPIDKVYSQKLSLMNVYDLTAGQDVSFSMA